MRVERGTADGSEDSGSRLRRTTAGLDRQSPGSCHGCRSPGRPSIAPRKNLGKPLVKPEPAGREPLPMNKDEQPPADHRKPHHQIHSPSLPSHYGSERSPPDPAVDI